MKKGQENFFRKVANISAMPIDVVSDLPRITLLGFREAVIENYKALLTYQSDEIKLDTKIGILSITGDFLNITSITEEEIILTGSITKTQVTAKKR